MGSGSRPSRGQSSGGFRIQVLGLRVQAFKGAEFRGGQDYCTKFGSQCRIQGEATEFHHSPEQIPQAHDGQVVQAHHMMSMMGR